MTDKPQELDEILNQLVSKTADASYGEWEVVGLPEAKQAIQALIRTEKLKLLAEVRERVIGEQLTKLEAEL